MPFSIFIYWRYLVTYFAIELWYHFLSAAISRHYYYAIIIFSFHLLMPLHAIDYITLLIRALIIFDIFISSFHAAILPDISFSAFDAEGFAIGSAGFLADAFMLLLLFMFCLFFHWYAFIATMLLPYGYYAFHPLRFQALLSIFHCFRFFFFFFLRAFGPCCIFRL